ncbi:EF-P 5-aminopentanol modification-associated protein YfmF [Staphylococcus argenteus]|uniref:EF-P 5-aminopentanol modification-associated protein YfmF n=1 Tax=Staphylococcus argenteus TaxID=985002 RepID=UPI000B588B14|nr:pitrilysin family protein [Staphylococcus argenteus]MDR7648825.1 pitrilysin family protein [Staphylococcus argenteus]MDR7681527.1 pitrilysin family protein [Staphylococcus argenteus]
MSNQSQPNIHINVSPTTKFKTTTIVFKFMAPLEYDTITARSLLSKLLVRATKKWPTDKAFNNHLAELYGACVNSTISKFKDQHVITFSLEIVNERYLRNRESLFNQGLDLLQEMIWNPLIENETFNKNYVNQEKTLLAKKIEALVDNKAQYSFLKLLDHMFENEAYKYLSTGQLEQIPHITAETLYHTYQSMINNDQCSVYVVGNVEPETVKQQIREKFAIKPFDKQQFQHSTHHLHGDDVDYIVEYDDVDQAKLNMGYRFPTQYGQPGYAAFVVFNMMFGGDPSSVLFNEVREKQSLAYSIHSQIDGKNGYLFVLSGVSSDKYEVAKDTIINEFEKIKNGDFTDEKLALAKKVIISHRFESEDRPKSIIEIMHNQILLEQPQSKETFINDIQNVSREDIKSVAKQAYLDTIYVLTKGGGK